MKRVLLSFALFLGMMATSNAQDSYTITSPDGKISVSVLGQNGKPQYSVSYDGKPIVAPSALGVQTNIGDFTSGMSLG